MEIENSSSLEIDLTGKTFCCFGLRKTGKSTFVNYIASLFGSSAFVYDTLGEVPEGTRYDCYTPINKYSIDELEKAAEYVKKSRKYRLMVIDEANRFCPPKPSQLSPQIQDLNDMCRHYSPPISVGFVCRRPSQLNSDLTEMAEYIFIFHLKGDKDIQYLENLSHGLGEAVLHLPDYHFILVNPKRDFDIFSPIEVSEEWLKGAESHLRRGLIP